MWIVAPPTLMPMRMPEPSSLPPETTSVQASAPGAKRATMSRLTMKPPAHRTTPLRARTYFSAPSMRTITPTTLFVRSTIRLSARLLQCTTAPMASARAHSFSISTLPPPQPLNWAVWPRGAGFAFALNGQAASLPDHSRVSSVVGSIHLPGR
ncbi:hypothetical protein MASR2M50_23330 [Thauera sp.]